MMGDIADDHIAMMQGFGRNPQGFSYRPKLQPTCKFCGAKNLHWGLAKGGSWALFENTRVHPGNYKPEHVCPTSADGFEEML